MVYKNLFYRLIFSLFFFLIFLLSYNNKYLLFILGSSIYVLIFFETLKFFKKFFKLIFIYLLLSFSFFALYFFIFFDYLIFNIFVFTIILFDSLSYFIGKLLGKNYIFKSISPKKTLEGYLGGIFFTNIFLICFFYLIVIESNLTNFIMFLNLIIFVSIIGDLIESYFKRINNIKDSSNYLPGHGGYFDRFDSFIFSIMILTLFSFISNL